MTTAAARRPAGRATRSSSAEAPLFGRAAELDLIDALLTRRGRADFGLLLSGEAGVGKSALLDAAAEQAAGLRMRVLRASGAEFEADIAYSALHQLLYPLRQDAERLVGPRHDALNRLFRLARATEPDPQLATAVLDLLVAVAAERPLLVIADNVTRFDEASAAALGFAVRRMVGAPILFLAAARTGTEGVFRQVRLPEHTVEPLTAQAAGELLDSRAPALAPTVRRRLLAEAAGNPLALRELPAALTERQHSGHDPLPAWLPLSRRLEEVFAAPPARLPAPTRELLLLAALDQDDDPTVLLAAARASAGIDDLCPAERAGLIHPTRTGNAVRFRHPLTASAIVHLTAPSERRAAHRALADALAGDAERRAWHLAQAAAGPDEAVARALDEAALSAWRRGGATRGAEDRRPPEGTCARRRRVAASAAVTALIRAGELSAHPLDRSRRLVEAAYLATITGQLDQVDRLLADAGQAPDTATGLLFAATAHLLTSDEGDIDAAYRLLGRALDVVADEDRAEDAAGAPDPETAQDWEHQGILYTLLLVSVYTLRPEPWKLLDSAMSRFDAESVATFRLCFDAYVDPTRDAEALRDGLADAFAALPADAAPWQLIPLAFAAVAMDALSDYRYLLHRMIERERDGGAIAMVIPGLMLLCHDSYVRGQWEEAEQLAQQSLELAVAYGYRFWELQVRTLLASGAALRGDAELARSASDQATTWAAPRGMEVTVGYARSARTCAALGQGDYEEAFVQAAKIDPPGAPSPGVPGRWAVLNLVEAAVRTGRTEQARAHVRAAQEAAIARIGPRTALITAGAAALAAGDETCAGALFEAALAPPEAARWPWEHARIQLAYGQWLRRTHDVARARLQLGAALETFERIGAAAMARRTGDELRATGVPVARPGRSTEVPTGQLTAQERQIAELAAEGLSNKQIGERLFLSHRTVASHLYRLYPKLGIASRAALRGALQARVAPETET